MKDRILKIMITAVLASSLMACGSPSDQFIEDNEDGLVVQGASDLVSIGKIVDNASVQSVSSDGSVSGIVGSSGGFAGSGQIINFEPTLPTDLAGDYEYRSATLNFKLSLVNKQKSCASGLTACVYLVPNQHHATVQAPGQCQAFGHEVEKFIYTNSMVSAGSIQFSNFISNKMAPCDKTTQAVRLLQRARRFSVHLSGDLTLTLEDRTVLKLKFVPIDWSKAIPMERTVN